ncbi:MAG: HD domain-containing phosphohydrolase [Mariprofundaceae bacterium]|nr:HD domain-containing phosphohydrolase [Mariprofundaceae bacterium]
MHIKKSELTSLHEENSCFKIEVGQLKKKLQKQAEISQSLLLKKDHVDQFRQLINQERAEWEIIFDAITDPVFLHNGEGSILHANQAYIRIAGQPLQHLIGKPYWHIFPKMTNALPDFCRGCHDDKGITMAIEDVDGSRFLSYRQCVRSVDNDCRYMVHFIQDVTGQLRANQLLETTETTETKLRQALEGSIQVIAMTLEARDPCAVGHQLHIADLARAMGEKAGLSQTRLEGIYFGGIIHDIGRIHLPDEIITCTDKLTKTQFLQVQKHAEVGYQILKNIDFPWPVADIAHQHHERLDGSGYPQGLQGKEICLEARIIAIADVVEAIVMPRPYRPSLGVETALKEISQGRGTLYEAQYVDICVDLFRNDAYIFQQ